MPVTITVRPTADGSYGNNWVASAGDKWACVDETPADDADYIERDNSTQAYQLFTTSFNAVTGMGPISAVNLTARARSVGATADLNFQTALHISGTATVLPAGGRALTNSFVDYTDDFIADRPGGGTWVFGDFLGATFQFGVRRPSTSGNTLRASQVYIAITGEFTGGFSCLIGNVLLPLVGLAGVLNREIASLLARANVRMTPDELRRVRDLLFYNPEALYACDL